MNENATPPPGFRWTTIWRGLRKRCPSCGDGPVYRAYLKPIEACGACAAQFGHIRADDFPPYLTIVVVGHIIVPLLVLTEKFIGPPAWVHLSLWLPLTLVLMFAFLPRLKGAVLAWMWMLGLSGNETQGLDAGE